ATDLARIGVFRLLELPDYRLAETPEDPEFRVHDLAWGKGIEDQGVKMLAYKCKFPGMDVTADVKLSYDPKTWKLVKRSISFETAPLGTSTTATETYEDYALSAEIS